MENLDKSRSLQSDYAVLVTGGSGYIGSHLVEELAKSGNHVVSLYRHRLPISHENVFPVCSDLTSKELLAAPLRNVETVFHLAWERNLIGPERLSVNDLDNQSKLSANLKYLKNLLEAMERAGTKRIVFVSAVGASLGSEKSFLQEKYLAEHLILNSLIPEKVIIRPSIIYGGENLDKFYESIKKFMMLPGFYPLPKSNLILEPIFVGDFINILSKITRMPLGEPALIFEIVGKEKLSIREIFKIISENCNKGSKIPITPYIGNSLIPLFEREKSADRSLPKLKHYLALGRSDNCTVKPREKEISTDLFSVDAFKSIKEVFGKSMIKSD